MASMPSQLNARIDGALKKNGDEVFARYGLSASEVVRAVWSYAAEHRRPPAFMTREADELQAKEVERKLALVEQGAGLMAHACCTGSAPADFDRGFASGDWADVCASLQRDHYDELASHMLAELQEVRDA